VFAADTARERKLQQAIDLMESKGDLAKAIPMFEDVAHSSDRALAARALLHLGDAQQRRGGSQARATYERIVKEFGSETETADAARQRLASLGAAGLSFGKRRVCTDCLDTDSRLSADGRWLVFTDWNNGDLAIRDMSNGQVKRLLAKPGTYKDDPAEAENSVLSPDLRQVAFSWDGNGKEDRHQVRVMPNEPGAKARVLVDSPGDTWYDVEDWSPDGKSILVMILHKPDQTRQVARISASDGSLKVLKELGWRRYNVGTRLSFSSDGQWIVYQARAVNPTKYPPAPSDPADTHIYMLSADGSGETEIVKTAGANEQPVWTSDGKHVLFTSNRTGQWDLWSVAIGDGRAAGPEILLHSGIGNISAMGIHSGSYYYHERYSTTTEYVNIVELAPSQNASGRVTRAAETFVGIAPSWSPDGKYIAFKRHHSGSGTAYDLVVHSLEAGDEKAFPTSLGFTGSAPPLWLPDGKAILTGLGGSQPPILGWYRVDLASGEWKKDSAGPNPVPNYVRRDTGIVAVDAATGAERQILAVPRAEPVAIFLSPDQGSIAVWRNPLQAGKTVLAIIDPDGSNYRELYTSALVPTSHLRELAWSKDSRAILFVQPSPVSQDNWRIMRIPAEGGAPEFTGVEVAGQVLSMDQSPDGSRIAFTTSKHNQELWALDNVLAEIK
jgi:Tol biopolymer transport system component